MIETHDSEQAERYAGAALAAMQRLGIPLHPRNFVIWYDYQSGRNLALKQEIDKLLGAGTRFTEEINAGLHSQHCASAREENALRETTHRVHSILDEVLAVTTTAQQATRTHGKALSAIGDEMALDSAVDQIAFLVNRALAETRALEQHNLVLADRLRTSTEEIDFLRHRLASVRHEAMTDALTGLANRKAFDTALEQATADATTAGEALAMLMIDIDHFKNFNDSWGHHFGDQVLKLVADLITGTVRGRDLVARYGGEEFAVLLVQTNLSGAVVVGENVRKALASNALINKRTHQKLGRITVSIGVAGWRRGEASARFIRRADAALYLAKRRGRDRVVGESSLAPAGAS